MLLFSQPLRHQQAAEGFKGACFGQRGQGGAKMSHMSLQQAKQNLFADETATQHILPKVLASLAVLWETSRCARKQRLNFRHELTGKALYQSGLSEGQLESLARKGYIERLSPVGTSRSNQNLTPRILEDSLFALTDAGAELVTVLLQSMERVVGADPVLVQRNVVSEHTATPHWDADGRQLIWGSTVLKQFCRAAPNQEAILTTFEELNWPKQIDDPLPPREDLVPQERLHEAIKSLNRGLRPKLIRFGGDGTGRGICWRYVATATKGDLS